MAKLIIKDLVESKELDRNVMKAISGGYMNSKGIGIVFVPGHSDVNVVAGAGSIGGSFVPVPYPTIGDGGTRSTKTKAGSSTTGYDDGGSVDKMIAAASFGVKSE